jgi:hypothetical protein
MYKVLTHLPLQESIPMYISPVSALGTIDLPVTPADRVASDRTKVQASRPEVLQAATQLVQQGGSEAASGTGTTVPVTQLGADSGDTRPSVELSARDINGDGAVDAVVKDRSSGARVALLSRGRGQVDPQAVSLSAPQARDLDLLSLTGKTAGRQFLAADLNADGNRQFAVKTDKGYVSLGSSGDGSNITDPATASGLKEAERRFGRLVGCIDGIVPGFVFGLGASSSRPDGRGTAVGFVQMLTGNESSVPQTSFDENSGSLGSLGGLQVMDSLGNSVSAFDPFGVGMRLFYESDDDAPAAAHPDTPAVAPKPKPRADS